MDSQDAKTLYASAQNLTAQGAKAQNLTAQGAKAQNATAQNLTDQDVIAQMATAQALSAPPSNAERSEGEDAPHIVEGALENDSEGYYAGVPGLPSLEVKENEGELAEQLQGAWHGMSLPLEEDVQVGAPQCQRCEVLPRPMTEAGILVLRFPHTFTLGKILGFLSKSQWKHTRQEGLIHIHAGQGDLPLLLSPLLTLMSSTEQRDVRAIFHFDGQLPQIADYFEVESLPDFVAEVRAAWLIEMLREKNIYSVFQPIVTCSSGGCDTQEVFGYECLMRGQYQGQNVSPQTMLEMARAADLLFQLDLAGRRAALLGASGHNISQKVFINFSPNAIYDPNHCLRSTVRTVDEVGLKRDQVVFEVTETERLPDMDLLRDIIRFYRDEGFQVALDDIGSGYSSLTTLIGLCPDYVKLDMELTRNVHRDKAKAIVTRNLLATINELGMKTVAEGVETADEMSWVREHGADFMQGYLFGKPATPPPILGAI